MGTAAAGRRRSGQRAGLSPHGSHSEAASGSEFDPSGSDLGSGSSSGLDGGDEPQDDLIDEGLQSGYESMSADEDDMDLAGEWDDADDDIFEQRRARYLEMQAAARVQEDGRPAPQPPDVEFDGGYRIPADIYDRLFDYQKTGEACMRHLLR